MSDDQGMSQNQNVDLNAKVKEDESHLSETARFVLPFLRRITGQMRDKGLIEKANELIKLIMAGKITPEDPRVIDFILACGSEKDNIIKQLLAEHAGTKAEAVVRNYFSKFLNKEIKRIA